MANPTQINYKVMIVGDCGAGKTTFVKRVVYNEFENQHISTTDVEIHPYIFSTNYGKQVLNLWDCGTKFSGSYYIGAKGAILFFDRTIKTSWENIEKWIQALRIVVPNIPIAIYGTKPDLNEVQLNENWGEILSKYGNIKYGDISNKTGFNIKKPLETILTMMCGVDDMRIKA